MTYRDGALVAGEKGQSWSMLRKWRGILRCWAIRCRLLTYRHGDNRNVMTRRSTALHCREAFGLERILLLYPDYDERAKFNMETRLIRRSPRNCD